uniref:Apple domain-containing protein n=1 Tax=Takifugu rubripes TaxID=31033 RepID=A0A3B5K478_TAKRU
MALQNNMDFPGSDVARVYASDAKHCQQLCTDHPSCMFFTFTETGEVLKLEAFICRHFYCYFKVTASGDVTLAVISFSEFPVYQNVDFLGADYKTLFTTNYGDCQSVCTDDPFCQFFTFVNGEYRQENIR